MLDNLNSLGYLEMTPIQQSALPLALAGEDLIAQAKTGSGKTAAFGLSLLTRLSPRDFGTQALILCPTRELALQIDQQIEGFSYFLPAHSIAIYGGGDGQEWAQQKKALTLGANIDC